MANLTPGAIEAIMTGETVDRPVLQVLGQKKIAGSGAQGGADRYRLLLSDGAHTHSSAMLATQLNDKITNGDLAMFTVIQLDKYICNTIQPDRRVMILLELSVVVPGSSVGTKIGNPQSYKAATAGTNGDIPPQQQPLAVKQQNRAPNTVTPPAPQMSSYSKPQPNAGVSKNVPPKPSFYNQNNANKSYGNLPDTPGGTPTKIHPIASLTPYQNRWSIRARVTSKSSIRTWSNSRGEGKLFSFNLIDDTGEIRATAFKEQVDKYYDMLEVGKVYYVSKAQLKTANKQYSSIDNDYEMTLNNDTQITLCDEVVDLPTINFNFVPINQLDRSEPNSNIDVIGVTRSFGDVTTIVTKTTNKELKKRDVHLVDEGKVQVNLTLWAGDAESFDGSNNPIIAIKGCRVSDFGGRSLSVSGSSQMVINPDIPEAHQLRGWYDNVGHTLDFDGYRNDGSGAGGAGMGTNWKTFSQVKSEGLGLTKPDYFSNKATIVFLKKENCMYMACPTADCNKKVIDQSNGLYKCEKCNKEFPEYKWRMILSANVADHTDNQWVTCFQDTAELVLGCAANDIGKMREQNESEFEQLFQDANFKSYNLKMRAKMETFNDESRLKVVAIQATPLNFVEYNNKIIGDIEKLMASI